MLFYINSSAETDREVEMKTWGLIRRINRLTDAYPGSQERKRRREKGRRTAIEIQRPGEERQREQQSWKQQTEHQSTFNILLSTFSATLPGMI